jgi:sarcosine dehydrogenase
MYRLEFIYNRLMRRGQARNAGFRALDCLSAEKGFRLWHKDLRSDDTPLEAGIGFTVNKLKLKNESFFGAKSLNQRQKTMSKDIALMTLNDNNVCVWGLEPIYYQNKIIGYVRRGSYGFSIDRPIAIGYLERDVGKVDSVMIEVNGKLYSAQVHWEPPFDPKGLRIRGIYY